MSDFTNYELTPGLNVCGLANDLLFDVAAAANYDFTAEEPADNISSLIGKVGPDKELQQNIGAVREALGEDSKGQIADWIERSGILFPVERSFADNSPIPEEIDTIIWGGGVANWMLRRAAMNYRFDPEKVGKVIIATGAREMKPAEHQLVKTLEKQKGKLPTESEFASAFIVKGLQRAGFRGAEVYKSQLTNGDDILEALFEWGPRLLNGNVLVVCNAPNAIQATGQLRAAAKKIDPSFDSNGDQLFMASDSIPLARKGEAAKTHQNPETALGQLVRNALFLERNRLI